MAETAPSYWTWLFAYYSRLRSSSAFANLSPDLQQRMLADAVAADHPRRAEDIRGWNTATREAMLALCDDATRQRSIHRRETLWRASKGARSVECQAVYMPIGTDLRLLVDGDLNRTLLVREPVLVSVESGRWRTNIAQAGWAVEPA